MSNRAIFCIGAMPVSNYVGWPVVVGPGVPGINQGADTSGGHSADAAPVSVLVVGVLEGDGACLIGQALTIVRGGCLQG
ncbi:hypothetical protein D3C79_679900 [compost metagenome]